MLRATFSQKFFLACLTALASTAFAAAKSPATFEEKCKALKDLVLTDQTENGGTVTQAEWIAQGMEGGQPAPNHCKLQGKLNERLGIEGKRYAIGFELRLPQEWNRRFYFQGGGGTDGVVRPALGAPPAGGVAPNALSNGFAVVSTDAGHQNQPGVQGNFLFGVDPKARADYGYNHLPVVNTAARELIEHFYGSGPKRAYFVGCSNGGRQGMMATQRFPDLFDGVIAAAPAYRVIEASIDAAAQTQILASIAPRDATNRPQLGAALSADDLATLRDGILKACDNLDGVADGMVHNIRECKFDPKSVQCASSATTACLSAEKSDAIARLFAGARNKSGELIYSAWPFDPGIATPLWTMWKMGPATATPPQALNTTLVAGALSHVFMVPPKPTADLFGFMLSVDLDDAIEKTHRAVAPYLESGRTVVNADSTDLDAFVKRGGKILFYHGMADGIFSPSDTVRYYEQLQTKYGKRADQFSRLYLIPGMGHCSGGPATDQFDAVTALIDWVEKKRAPQTLIAKAAANSPWPNRSRPLCPYPTQAMYSGSGDIEQAASFVCR